MLFYNDMRKKKHIYEENAKVKTKSQVISNFISKETGHLEDLLLKTINYRQEIFFLQLMKNA